MADITNPYAPPEAALNSRLTAFRMLSDEPMLSMRPRRFEVGDRERHTVEVRVNLMTGEETYLVDGIEQMRTRTWWGRRRFSVGEREIHDVEVLVAASGRISVFVDRLLVHNNLFPGLPLIPPATAVAVVAILMALTGALFMPAGLAALLRMLSF